MSESPTRAVVARRWLAALQARVPSVQVPPALLGLPANEPVTACRVPSGGVATTGLGTNADVAVLIVSAGAPEAVARVDSSKFELYLPPNVMVDVDESFTLPSMNGTWPLELIPSVSASTTASIELLLASAYEKGSELLAFGADTPAQPGQVRRDRLVFADACGRVELGVSLTDGAVVVMTGSIEPLSCRGGTLRTLLARRPAWRHDGRSLTLSSGATRLVLSHARPTSPGLLRLTRYTSAGASNEVPADVHVGTGGLRPLTTHDGCNHVETWIVVGSTRFELWPEVRTTQMPCTPSVVPTAAAPFIRNAAGHGTWSRKGAVITLRFADGAVAELRSVG